MPKCPEPSVVDNWRDEGDIKHEFVDGDEEAEEAFADDYEEKKSRNDWLNLINELRVKVFSYLNVVFV